MVSFSAHLTLYSRTLVTANAAVAVRNPGNAKVAANPQPATRGSALRRREGFTRTIAHGSTRSWRTPERSLHGRLFECAMVKRKSAAIKKAGLPICPWGDDEGDDEDGDEFLLSV